VKATLVAHHQMVPVATEAMMVEGCLQMAGVEMVAEVQHQNEICLNFV